MTAAVLASKFRRARRNGTGLTIGADQIDLLAEIGVYDLIARAEAEEMCLAKTARSGSTPTGSTSAGMASPPTSGRSPPIPRDRGPLSIEALSAAN